MRRLLSLLLLVCFAAVPNGVGAAPPTGFTRVPFGGPWDLPVGMTFDANGRAYVWEKAGRVWIVENGVKSAQPLVDISDEVGNWQDHGLLGFALHPNFLQNGYIYLLYAVDHYYLNNAGTPGYDPNQSETEVASIGRLTRYTARSSDGFHSVDPQSRRILLGESKSTGCPLLSDSHGVGSVVFGADDSLLASCGDGASFNVADGGGPVSGSFATQALLEGIIQPKEDVGAFRAQLPSSLAGKILRLDPQTGDGLPSNPFYDPNNPRSTGSRLYALGLRNAFRFSLRPGTGSHIQADANPGSLYVGNVGWNTWEELEVIDGPGYNSGWPVFEGLDPNPQYSIMQVPNQDAPNPLSGAGGCNQPFFYFTDLIVPETLGTPSWPNPCNPAQQIPATIPRFMETRPTLTYGRAGTGPMLVPTWNGNNPSQAQVGAPGSPVQGTSLGGATTTGGVWYTGTDFPAAYRNTFFSSEFSYGYIANIQFDAQDKPTFVQFFDSAAGEPTMLATSPTSGGLYMVDVVNNAIWQYQYVPSGNQPPSAAASAAPLFGPTPLSVAFSSAGSADPESQALTYSWNFGDGSPASTAPNPVHTFFAPVGVSAAYLVTLTVRDPGGLSAGAQVNVAVNDTPPQVTITSPQSQSMYPMTGNTQYALTASLNDAEQGAGNLTCQWQVTLHRNGQLEPMPIDAHCSTTATIQPIGCDGSAYYYTFALTVFDSFGLATQKEVSVYPNCASVDPVICGNLDANAVRNSADVFRLRFALANPLTAGLSPGEFSRCSVIGGSECDVTDATVLRRYLAGRAPGPAPVCPAAAP
ncbi:MAG TPA: PQQ-dependent sugar dehydrogenase [Myxococcota bacterium]|nr:PQQ-dependent sugar dehydrogenase [Myxococcota bacterium]